MVVTARAPLYSTEIYPIYQLQIYFGVWTLAAWKKGSFLIILNVCISLNRRPQKMPSFWVWQWCYWNNTRQDFFPLKRQGANGSDLKLGPMHQILLASSYVRRTTRTHPSSPGLKISTLQQKVDFVMYSSCPSIFKRTLILFPGYMARLYTPHKSIDTSRRCTFLR